jgi:uncharacterized membrane protein YoaK (UPF0700 family)
MGATARVVPSPGGLVTAIVPPSAPTRSVRPALIERADQPIGKRCCGTGGGLQHGRVASLRPPVAAPGVDLRWQHRRVFLVGLTAAAGWLDALAFLHLGRVFISLMSGNLVFVGIGVGNGEGGLVVRAGAVLVAFLAGTAAGARLTGGGLVPGPQSRLGRTLLLEAAMLAAFALVWVATGSPADHAAMTVLLLVLGAAAMGLQAAIALALHLPNVATVAMTATLAQLGAVVVRRKREGRPIVSRTPAVALMIALSLAYLISALVVAAVPETPAMAFGPLLLLAVAIRAR